MLSRSLITLLFLSPLVLSAQQDLEFFVNGNARQLNDSCFQLTTETQWQVGSIWYPEKIDLRNNFDLVMDMFFGCLNDLGADGIVFGLQPISASVGQAGEGLGIGGVSPAIGIEFDTWHNDNRLDPLFDHVAIMANGAVTHSGPNNLAGPVQASRTRQDIENCRTYPFRVTWNAGDQVLRVYFDCDLRLEYEGDIINDVFDGDPFVFYGFAAATGGAVNRQEICFTFNSFQKQLQDVTMCPGGNVLLDVSGGAAYEWAPAEGLSSITAPSVDASPDTTTVYTVKIFDDCGIPLIDTVRIAVEGDSAFVRLGPDTTLCPGDALTFDVPVPTAVYEWSDPRFSGPTATIDEPGTYSVTATRTDIICTAADRIEIGQFPVPEFDIGVEDTTLCLGEVLEVTAVFPDGQGFLEGGTPFDTVYVGRPGPFRAYLEHPCAVIFDEVNISFSNCRQYYLPTAFSPDGNGANDRFYPQEAGDIVRIHNFAIYNRWGALLFEANDLPPNTPELGWDGTFQGEPAPPGVYVWMMDVDFRNGNRRVERGSVTLVR